MSKDNWTPGPIYLGWLDRGSVCPAGWLDPSLERWTPLGLRFAHAPRPYLAKMIMPLLIVIYISINYNRCIYSYRHNYDCMCAIIIITYTYQLTILGISIYLLIQQHPLTTPLHSNHTHRFHPLATPASC